MADQDPSLKTQDPHAPLELIAEGRQSIDAICRASKMSILELAEHVCTPRNLEALGRVAQLHAIEREILLGRLKREALVRLAELTAEVPAGSADEIRAFEVMRKACADILRFGNGPTRSESRNSDPGGPRSGGHHPDSITPAFEAEVLEALEKLGAEDEEEEHEEEVYPQIPQMSRGGFKSGNGIGNEVAITTSKHTDSASRGCHGQVPPARACESPADSRAKSPRRPCPWHPPPPSESHLSMASISRNGPGAGASGSYSPPLPITDDRILPDDAHPP